MKKYIFIIISIVLLTSCSETKELITTTCNTNNPLEDLTWLYEIKTNFDKSASASKKQIIQYTYKNETVFMIDICNGCSDNLTAVYNCEGTVICEFGGIAGVNTCPDFDEKATNQKIVWEN
jgi:PBP1b-binding outer membrane lipoprotein LpoB